MIARHLAIVLRALALSRSAIGSCFLAIGILSMFAMSAAHAADEPPARVTTAQFGFSGNLQTERWAPLRITIDAVRRPFSGTLVVSYPQDHTQRATLHIPAAGTPGVATPVDTVINLKSASDAVSITLLDERGRPVDRLRFGNTAEDPDASPLTFDEREGMILCLGRTTPDRIIEPIDLAPNSQDYLVFSQPQQWSAQRMSENRGQRLRTLRAVPTDPLALPSQWAAFDSAEAIVLRTEELTERIAPASREAITRWVEGGGRLVLVIDQPGDLWKLWLPGELSSLITIGDPGRQPVPPVIKEALEAPDMVAARAMRDLQRSNARANPPVPPTPPAPNAGPPVDDEGDVDANSKVEETSETADIVSGSNSTKSSDSLGLISSTERAKQFDATFPVAGDLPGRPISLHPSLLMSGWRIEAKEGQTSVFVHGPIGLGYVTILTTDPALAAVNPAPEPSRRAWLAVLAPGLEDWLSLPVQPAAMRQQWWGMWGGGTSGSNDLQRQSITLALNAVADRPGRTLNPAAVLIALLVCALILTILLGPVDGLVLGLKRKLHWSWATALTWIIVISVIAGFTPWLVRGDLPTMRLSRAVENVVIDQTGPVAWRSTVHGLFAASPGERQLFLAESSFPSGSIFRGVGVGQSWDNSRPTMTPLELHQSTTLSPRGSEQSIWPLPIQQGQWALRNMFAAGPVSSAEDPLPIRARVIRLQDQQLQVEVDGVSQALKAGCKIESITLRGRDPTQVHTVDLSLLSDSQPAFTTTISLHTKIPAYSEKLEVKALQLAPFSTAGDHAPRRTFGSIEDIPVIQRHELAIESRLATQRWALVTVECTQEIAASKQAEPSIESHRRIIRLLVPIEGSATPAPEAGVTP